MASRPLLPLVRTRDPDFEERFSRVERRTLERRREVDRVVEEIVEDVRRRGDAALLEAIERYDGHRLTAGELIVPPDEIEGAASGIAPDALDALRLAAERVRSYHESHVPRSWRIERPGEVLGQEVRAVGRVGINVPGAQAPLASTVLMTAIPARVAGVREIVIQSPARRHPPAILEAARLSGVGEMIRAGGAHGVAALAYGTETIRAVDKIVGPGSVWVQAAKRRVFGEVGIDADAGPSEVLIVADAEAPAAWVAADLLAQAEHEEAASVVLCTPDEGLASAVSKELDRQIGDLPRAEVARRALGEHGLAVVTRDLDEAVDLANRYGPEHLQLMTREPEDLVSRIQNAGAVFLGNHSPVPAGDYVAGPSHVLPTGGTSRFFSPLGVEDFLRRMSLIRLGPAVVGEIGPAGALLAELEGLEAHARSIRSRLRGTGPPENPGPGDDNPVS